MKYTTYILKKEYKEYMRLEAFKKCKFYIDETVDFIKSHDIIDKNDISINADFVHWFNELVGGVYVDDLAGKYAKLSNNKKRQLLSKAMLYTLKLKYSFDRSHSIYNKEAKCYTKKRYFTEDKLSINDLLKNIGMMLKGDIIITKEPDAKQQATQPNKK